MRGYRDDDQESGSVELACFLCVVAATAVAFFVCSGRTEIAAHAQFMEPVRMAAPAAVGAGQEAAGAALPHLAPRPHWRPTGPH